LDPTLATERIDVKEKALGVWLGGRDSNPDNVVQRYALILITWDPSSIL